VANTNAAKVVSLGERRHASLGTEARKLQRPSIIMPDEPSALPPRFGASLILSVVFHVLVVFFVTFALPNPRVLIPPSTTLDVVLVNSKSAKEPINPDVLAQANLDGGGNTDEKRRVKSPLPVAPVETNGTDNEELTSRVQDLEQQARQLMTQIKSDKKVDVPSPDGQPTEKHDEGTPADLVEKSMQMVRMQGQVSRNWDSYQQRPKRTFIGARAKEFRFAMYADQWRQKIEQVGNLNYPEEAKISKLYGSLQMTVAIKADGTVERVDINRSSGYKVLDDAAKRIVLLASPFSRFPDEVRKDTDILEITRTWAFTREDQMSAE